MSTMALLTTTPASATIPIPVITTIISILKVAIPPNTPIVLNNTLKIIIRGLTSELN